MAGSGAVEGHGWARRMVPMLLHQRGALVMTLASAVAGMLATSLTPLLMRTIVDDAILRRVTPIAPLLGLMVGLGVLRLVVGFGRRYFGAKVGTGVDYELRNKIYDHLQRLDFTRHDQMQTGQLVSRANSDVQILQQLLAFLPLMLSNALLFPISLTFMLRLSPPLMLVGLVTIPALLYLTIRMRKVVYPSSWDVAMRDADVANVVDEAVTGVRIVKGFGQEQRELDRLVDAATRLYGARMRNVRISAKRQASMQVVPLLAQVAVLGFGGLIAIDGGLTVGSFLAFLTYLAQLIAPIQMMAQMLVISQMARASAERILEILDSTPEVVEQPEAVELSDVVGEIRFEDVSFGYLRSQPVLDGFSLTVRPGETVALVGASGSGKSTVALLLPRFYDAQEGAVRIDGTDVRDVTLTSLRAQIGVVFEDSFLFSDTIRSNIAYGRPDASDADIEAAAKAAEAHQFILDLPEGYDTVVGERGLSLSGGQRQRVALARAIITDPRILLLDDATSSIDVKVEEDIHRTLRSLMKGRTTILVAHRRSSLALADRIVVLSGGKVIDEGQHDELLDRCRLYRLLLSGPGEDIDSLDARQLLAAGVTPPPEAESAPEPGARAAARPAGPIAMARVGTGPGAGPGGAMGGMGMGAGARAFGMAPAELEEAIAKLPPVRDVPGVDVAAEARDRGDFRLGELLRPYRTSLLIGLGLVGLNAVLGLAGPWLIRRGIDHGVVAGDRRELLVAVAAFVAVTLVARVVGYGSSIFTSLVGQRLLFALRVRVFAQLQRLGLDFYDREMGGRIMTRMTSDITAMNALLQTGLIQALVQMVQFLGTVAVLFTMSWRLALFVLTIVPPLVVATLLYRKASGAAYLQVRDGVAAVNANFQESISGIRVAQAFGRESRNMSTYRDVTGEYKAARLRSQRIASLYFPFVEMVSVVANVVVLGIGARYIADGSLTPGALIAFNLYITTVFAPIQQLSNLFDTYQQARAAMTKLTELLRMRTSIAVADEPVRPGRLRGEIELEDVHFAYVSANREALRGANLRVEAGQTVALVGETGAGKSTIVKLLARFYEPTAGRILVDGIPLPEIDLVAYRQQLGYVPQEPFLFSGTVHENIAYGRPDASRDEVVAAAEAVGAHDFITGLPEGYDQAVTERGRSLSAGQRQLIALARALLVDPVLLLLDEATANLDLATEARVNRAMGVVAQGRTTILVAHRLPTAHGADRIIVIDDGQVVEDGAPADLLARGGRYASLWRTYNVEAPADSEVTAAEVTAGPG